MIEEQGHSVPTTNTSPTAASLSSRDTETDQELDSIALQLGFDNRESVWSATARFLRASSVFKRALWAWLNHPTIALLACIMPNLVLVCVIIRPGWSWKSVIVMVSYHHSL